MENSGINKRELNPFTPYLYLLIAAQILFFFLLLKSPEYSVLCLGLIVLPIVLIRFPEVGLAIAMTSNIVLMVLFDNLKVEIPMPVLFLYIIMVYGGSLYYYLDHQSEISLKMGKPHVISLLLMVLLILGLLYSSNKSYGLFKIVFFYLFNLTLLFAPILYIREIDRIESIIKLAYVFGLILGVVATGIALVTPDFYRFRPSENVNPIWLARSLGVTAIAGFYMILEAKRGMAKLLYAISLFFFIYPIFRSWSRAPLLGLVLILIMFLFLQPHRSLAKKILLSSFFGIGLVIIIINTTTDVAARLQTPLAQEWSAAFRFIGWFSGIKDFLSSPLMGIGTGAFFLDLPYLPFKYPHNLFIELACENGIFGLGLMIAFVYVVIKIGAKSIQGFHKEKNSKYVNLSIVMVLIFIYALWNSMFSGNISGNEIVWFGAGLIYALNESLKSGFWKTNSNQHPDCP
jgi:O-antigen ligase